MSLVFYLVLLARPASRPRHPIRGAGGRDTPSLQIMSRISPARRPEGRKAVQRYCLSPIPAKFFRNFFSKKFRPKNCGRDNTHRNRTLQKGAKRQKNGAGTARHGTTGAQAGPPPQKTRRKNSTKEKTNGRMGLASHLVTQGGFYQPECFAIANNHQSISQ